MRLVEVVGKARALHWLLASVLILLVDYITGPFVQFAILLVIPVALATVAHGLAVGCGLAVLLPLVRFSFLLQWDIPWSWGLELIDTGVDVLILAGFAGLIHQMKRQRQQIRVLEGMLPICSFCKRIRDERGQWRQLESFISERSDAQFSHTFCEGCGRAHYSELAE